MARDSLGIDVKRAFILPAATAAVLFAVISLMPGEPAAQTASSNGKIAYVGFDTETENQYVYTMNADGTGVANLTRRYVDAGPPVLGNVRGDPEWSPDGTQITFTSDRAGQKDIWAVDAPPTTPSAPVALLTLSLDTDPAWAASEARNLTAGAGVEARSPDWGTASSGGAISCTIKDISGVDSLTGTSGADVICGLGGQDAIEGRGGADVLRGGSGVDTIEGGSGADELYGGGSADTLDAADGVRGNDASFGGPGADSCNGDRGDDKRGCP
jgi:Ca2+-binding RTX toxin-like protein